MILFIFGCVEWGLLQLRCSASHCGGFSCCGARARGHVGSVVAAPRLQSTGSGAVARGLSCSAAWGDFPGAGIEPVSRALAGRFFTTESPGKPSALNLQCPYPYSLFQILIHHSVPLLSRTQQTVIIKDRNTFEMR